MSGVTNNTTSIYNNNMHRVAGSSCLQIIEMKVPKARKSFSFDYSTSFSTFPIAIVFPAIHSHSNNNNNSKNKKK